MRNARLFRAGVIWLMCLNVAAPRVAGQERPAVRPTPAPQTALVGDVSLGEGGTLSGVMVDENNQPQPHKPLRLYHGNQPAAELITDQQGRFAVAGLKGGVYSLRTDDAIQVIRLWAPGTAPPHAPPEVLFVSARRLLRGQRPHPVYSLLFGDPLLLGVIVAAAIAIPIALHNIDDDDES